MGLSLAFCFLILIFAICVVLYIKNKTIRNDQKKISEEVGSDFEDDLFSSEDENVMENLIDWVEK